MSPRKKNMPEKRHFKVNRFYKLGWDETPTPEHLEAVRNCKTEPEYQYVIDANGNKVRADYSWQGIVRENPSIMPSTPAERKAYHAARNIERPVPCKPKRAAAAVEMPKRPHARGLVCRFYQKVWDGPRDAISEKPKERFNRKVWDEGSFDDDDQVPEPTTIQPDPSKYFCVVINTGDDTLQLSERGLDTYNAKKALKPLEIKDDGDLTPPCHYKLIALRTDPDLISTIEQLGQKEALGKDLSVRIVTLPVSEREDLEIDELDDRERPIPDYQDVVCDMIAMAGETDWKSTFEQCRELIMLNRGRQ